MEENQLLEKALLRTLEKNRSLYESLSPESQLAVDAKVLAFVNALRCEVNQFSDAQDIYSTLRVLVDQESRQ